MKFLIFILICMQLNLSFAQAGAEKMDYSQKIEKFFNDFNKDKLDLVYEFYSKDTHFEDPLGKHAGVESVKSYYANLYKNVESIRFDFSNHVCSKDQCVSVWVMHLKAAGLNGGNPIALEGNSVFKFNTEGKAIYHRDYFDMGAFIYEHIPVLKNIISYIKSKLKA